MALLDRLFQKFGAMQRADITLQQLEELRDGLKSVEAVEIASLTNAQDFLSLLRKFREGVAEADKLHGDNYPQLLNSLLSVGEDGLYSNNLRFIFELIQNVDDCEFANTEDHSLDIHFDFNHDKIVLRYNEEGFTPFNVFAITGIAEAAKNVSAGKNEIGEKGIGFKSVFGVTNTVLIRSGWFSFKLHKENFTIPIASYQTHEYCPGTEMTLFVPGGKAGSIYSEIKEQYCNKDALFSRNPLLFLNKLTSLRMHYDEFRTMEFRVSRPGNPASSKFYKDEDVHISVDLHDYELGLERNVVEEIYCTRYTSSVVFGEAACKSRYGAKTKVGSNGGKPMTLQVVFPYPEYLDTVGNGALYSFLPTQLRFNVPVVCHVPFKLDASREFVDPQENNIWFRDAIRYLSELLDYAYQDWARIIKNDIIAYLPSVNRSLFADNNGKEKCLSSQKSFKGGHFSKLPIFFTSSEHFVDIDKVFCFDSAEEIYEPEEAYFLLPLSKELFTFPKQKSFANIGIQSERNIYHRLFSVALKDPAKTGRILQYLNAAEFHPMESNIPSETFELTQEQVGLFMRYEDIAKLFGEYAKKCLQAGRRPVYRILSAVQTPIQDALYQDFKLSETPKAVERYLRWCQEKCVLIDIGEDQYFPCYNALVLSVRNPLTSFSAFCYAVDSKDTFSIRMKHKEISDRLNRLSESDEGSAEDYLRELRNNRQLGRDAIGKQQYQNYIDLILRSGISPVRFIQELLQNADDCEYGEGIVPEFSLHQDQSKIVTEYNEVGFTRGNIRSITAIGESTKTHLMNQDAAKIGEKGVGFKTIFSIASEVRIHSGMYHFSLLAKAPTIPESLKDPHDNTLGTRMEIVLKQGIRLSNYSEKDMLEFCLCLRKLRKIRINNTFITIEDSDNIRTVTINKRQHTFRRFIHHFSMSDEALRERENGLRSISSGQSIVCYIPDKGAAKDYPLYCGLPTRHRIKIPLVVDAPFMLTTSREEIEFGSRLWNDRVRAEVYASLLSIMDETKRNDRHKVLRLVRFVPRRQGTQTVYTNDFSDCEYLNQYDFLSEVRAANLLPTFERSVFVSVKSSAAYRFPEAANYLFEAGCFGAIPATKVLDIPRDESFDSTLNAMGCVEAPFAQVIPLLKKYAGNYIENDIFRESFYAYLQKVPEEYLLSLKEAPIIPVFSIQGDQTQYIPWKDDVIFVKKNCTKSEHNYYVLNERILPKSTCEKIFGVNINEMNAEWERSRYNDGLRDIICGSDTAEIYKYLIEEFFKGSFVRYRSQEILMGMREFIPLRNQLGKIIDTGVFICNEPMGYFRSSIVLSIAVHDECRQLAEYLKYPLLSKIHYQDILYVEDLTEDDIEDFTDDYFENGEEILRNFHRNGQLSDDLIDEYGLEYITMQSGQDDDDLEFPENPVSNMERLRKHIQTLLNNPIKIVARKVELTVHKARDSSGREFGLDDRTVREQTLKKYTPDGVHGRCFCQMCRKVKPYELMEVNNIIAAPRYFFTQTRVALCLECSKKFEAIRFANAPKGKRGREDPFAAALKAARIVGGCVDVAIGKESIRFTATHLAEIQEILRSMPDK